MKSGLPPKNFPFWLRTSLINSKLFTTKQGVLPRVKLKMSPYVLANSVNAWNGDSCVPKLCKFPIIGKGIGPGAVFNSATSTLRLPIFFHVTVFREKSLYAHKAKMAIRRIALILFFLKRKIFLSGHTATGVDGGNCACTAPFRATGAIYIGSNLHYAFALTLFFSHHSRSKINLIFMKLKWVLSWFWELWDHTVFLGIGLKLLFEKRGNRGV